MPKNKRGEETRKRICEVLRGKKLMQREIAKELGLRDGTISHQMVILEIEERVKIVAQYGNAKIYALKQTK